MLRFVVSLVAVLLTLPLFAQEVRPRPAAGIREEGDTKDISFVVGKKFPQVEIPKENRFANFADRPGDGNCMWVALDTLLKTNGSPILLSKNRWGGVKPDVAYETLVKSGIPTIYKRPYTGKDLSLLRKACDEGYGAVVTVDNGIHALNVVGIEDEVDSLTGRLAIIDNNDKDLAVRYVSKKEFLERWNDAIMIPLKKDYDGPLAKQCGPQGCAPTQGGSQYGYSQPQYQYSLPSYSQPQYQTLPQGPSPIGQFKTQPIAKQFVIVDNRPRVVYAAPPTFYVEQAPTFIVAAPSIALPTFYSSPPTLTSSWEGPLGIRRERTYSDGVIVRDGLFGRRVYYPR